MMYMMTVHLDINIRWGFGGAVIRVAVFHSESHIRGVRGCSTLPPPLKNRIKSRSKKIPMKSKTSVPTSIGFEYANNAKLFSIRSIVSISVYRNSESLSHNRVHLPPPPKKNLGGCAPLHSL